MDYEKLHKDTIAKLQEMVNSGKITVEIAHGICADFVSESEDEKVRKWIRKELESKYVVDNIVNNEMADKALAWLEKQGENTYNKELSELLHKVICRFINDPNIPYTEREKVSMEIIPYVERLEKQGEQKSLDDIAKEVIKDKDAAISFLKSTGIMNENGELAEQYRQDEQNPTDKVEPKFKVGDVVTNKKSKDTVKIVQILHDSYCYSGWDGAAIVHSDFSISEQDDWELVEQKPAWSEEDENYKDALIGLINEIKSQPLKRLEDWDSYLNWLKSLKDRYTWKPSNEQMEGIECTIKTLRYQLNCGDNRLDSLYNDLKKLRDK